MNAITRFPKRPILLLAAALATVAAGCGGADGVERAELEDEVRTSLSASVGQQAPEADCPEELESEVGATTRCSMTFPDGELGITVKVTAVDGDDVRFDVQADDELEAPR